MFRWIIAVLCWLRDKQTLRNYKSYVWYIIRWGYCWRSAASWTCIKGPLVSSQAVHWHLYERISENDIQLTISMMIWNAIFQRHISSLHFSFTSHLTNVIRIRSYVCQQSFWKNRKSSPVSKASVAWNILHITKRHLEINWGIVGYNSFIYNSVLFTQIYIHNTLTFVNICVWYITQLWLQYSNVFHNMAFNWMYSAALK